VQFNVGGPLALGSEIRGPGRCRHRSLRSESLLSNVLAGVERWLSHLLSYGNWALIDYSYIFASKLTSDLVAWLYAFLLKYTRRQRVLRPQHLLDAHLCRSMPASSRRGDNSNFHTPFHTVSQRVRLPPLSQNLQQDIRDN
jgi:hypothetical protein